MANIPTVKIPADNPRGFKIVNADDPRVKGSPESEVEQPPLDPAGLGPGPEPEADPDPEPEPKTKAGKKS